MKKILIPTLLATTVAPLITTISCGHTWDVQWDLSDGEFKWEHDIPEIKIDYTVDVTDLYFEKIDKDILADDIIIKLANQISAYPDDYKSATIKIKVDKLDKKEQKLSFTIFVDMTYKLDSNSEWINASGSLTFKNVPFNLTENGVEGAWWRLEAKYVHDYGNKIVLEDWYWNNQDWSL